MQPADFVVVFIEMYNAVAALVLVFFIAHILLMMKRVDKPLLKARLFLDEAVTERTWIYISAAGAGFALNSLLKFMAGLTAIGNLLEQYYVVEITQVIFIVAFILAAYNWYTFIGSFTKHAPSKA